MDVEDAKAKLGDKVKLVSGDAKTVNGAGDSTEKNGDSAEAEVRNDFISNEKFLSEIRFVRFNIPLQLTNCQKLRTYHFEDISIH